LIDKNRDQLNKYVSQSKSSKIDIHPLNPNYKNPNNCNRIADKEDKEDREDREDREEREERENKPQTNLADERKTQIVSQEELDQHFYKIDYKIQSRLDSMRSS